MNSEELDAFEDQLDAMGDSLGVAAAMASGFTLEMRRIQDTFVKTNHDAAALEKGLSRGLRSAFDDVVLDGAKLSDALRTVANSMVNTVYSAAVKPATDHFGGLLAQGLSALVGGILPFESGGSFAQGRVMPFASGGIVSSPTMFPMRGGTGLMGEAGPEAIMPLARGADGKLGVRAGAGNSVTVVMNIQTPDAQSFQRSQSQIAGQMSRLMGRAQRIR